MKKSEKRKREKFKEKEREIEDMFKNPTPQVITTIENYCVFNLLYLNDTACNAIKFLESDLVKRSYKGKWAKTLYNAAMKRVNAYFELIEQAIDINSIANLFVEMDGYVDDLVIELKVAIRNALVNNGYEYKEAEWVASVETAYTLCNYAVGFGNNCIENLKKLHDNQITISVFKKLFIVSIEKVMHNFSNWVVEASPCKYNVVDLNMDAGVRKALGKLNKVYMNPSNFINAVNVADKENEQEGYTKLM